MTFEEVTKLCAVLKAEYSRNFEVSEERIKLWHTILGHATYVEASRAVAQLLSEARPFPPQVGEVNQAILAERKRRAIERVHARAAASRPALPTHVMLDDESRERCVSMLRECVSNIARMKSV